MTNSILGIRTEFSNVDDVVVSRSSTFRVRWLRRRIILIAAEVEIGGEI